MRATSAFSSLILTLCLQAVICGGEKAVRLDPAKLVKEPSQFPGVTIADGKATLASDRWAFLVTPAEHHSVRLQAEVTIEQPAKQFDFFGSSWSVWPDRTVPDGGFEAALLLRGGKDSGFRVQWSHRYQEIALVKYPEGGYLQSVPCPVHLNKPQTVKVALEGNRITIHVDGQQRIRYQDRLFPLDKGRCGIGVSSQAKVSFEKITLEDLGTIASAAADKKHVPNFSVRKWLGGRPWVFDGHEPIMLLPVPEASGINNVKLVPGYKPMLSWNGHWDIQNQGAFPEGTNTITPVKVSGGGKTITATWNARQVKDRFVTRTALTVGFDDRRGTYTYDTDSELEVLPGEPFHFRYGFDFEHHTPLDPFRWQYLMMRREGGLLNHRPVYPIDPGQQQGLEQNNGARIWYGRHNEKMFVAPAVEYFIDPKLNADPDKPGQAKVRKLNTAVCAAFYDTGVSFEPETAKAGTKVRVKYRYTGYPAKEAEALFQESSIYPSPTLDPDHHYIFADEWPKLTFKDYVPLSQTWIYGRRPFLTGHNVRPTYELAKDAGAGSGHAMKLGPGAYGKAGLAIPDMLQKGRYLLTVLVKSNNTHGPGGRIELEATEVKTNKPLLQVTHHVGNGTFAWKKLGFAFELPNDAGGLSVAFGNAGTGEMLITDVEFTKLSEGAALPAGVLAQANDAPPKTAPAPEGALVDYRMEEGKGLHVYNHAKGPVQLLELANLDWVVDDGRPALKFADNTKGQAVYPIAGNLDLAYMRHTAYQNRQTIPVALAGTHGGGFDLKAFTIAAFVKPAAAMGKSEHGGWGDIAGLGARRIILQLHGQEAPYKLGASLNVSDRFTSDAALDAGRWYHVALSGEPTANKKWRIRLYLDGKQVHEGVTTKLEAPMSIPPSLVLGTEIFYFHHAYYRGLIGRTLVFERALSAAEIENLARK